MKMSEHSKHQHTPDIAKQERHSLYCLNEQGYNAPHTTRLPPPADTPPLVFNTTARATRPLNSITSTQDIQLQQQMRCSAPTVRRMPLATSHPLPFHPKPPTPLTPTLLLACLLCWSRHGHPGNGRSTGSLCSCGASLLCHCLARSRPSQNRRIQNRRNPKLKHSSTRPSMKGTSAVHTVHQ